MRWIFEREYTAANRCCFCCHIRTGTVIFGLVNLTIQACIVAALITFIIRPDVMSYLWPTEEKVSLNSSTYSTMSTPIAIDLPLAKHRLYGESNSWRRADNLLFAIMFITLLIGVTLGLVYGVLRGRPKYMMPYFFVQLFDIGISGMTMLSYFSSVQEMKRWIAEQNYLPLGNTILRLNDDHLMVLTLVIFVAVLFCKMYFIGVVWSCYKYLQHYARIENVTFRRYNVDMLNNIEDSEVLLPPKYEDVILMPSDNQQSGSPPPPAYSDD